MSENTASINKINVNIVGAGLAGLAAAVTLSENNIGSSLISLLPSERSQSVLAEGGINGALNTMGEEDKPEYHFADTMKAGVYIADEEAVRGLTQNAPLILKRLKKLGVPFNLKNEQVQQRNFGGQKKKRTAYARSSTGKVLMTAMTDEARKYETQGLITRYSHHELIGLELTDEGKVCSGVRVKDTYTGKIICLDGPVIMATGGMNGIFPGRTTGTVTNSGDAAAILFFAGVRFGNLEMIQYHPTTIAIALKRCLVSEAARGEGGRLYVIRGGEKWYFMEEKYPELGNLMPRDVVAREMYFVVRRDDCGDQVWLDMHHLQKAAWKERLPDLRKEVIHYLGIDPARDPIPVEPGIHYFMGGIDVDIRHRSSVENLYAAGECCCQYHGANRLGGNSTLGAIYGGSVAAEDIAKRIRSGEISEKASGSREEEGGQAERGEISADGAGAGAAGAFAAEKEETAESSERNKTSAREAAKEAGAPSPALAREPGDNEQLAGGIEAAPSPALAREPGEHEQLAGGIEAAPSPALVRELSDIMYKALGIVRNGEDITEALAETDALEKKYEQDEERPLNARERARIALSRAILMSALERKESRGAHYRKDYPETKEEFKGTICARMNPETGAISIDFRPA